MFMEKSRRIIKDTDKCRKTKPYQGYFVSLYNNNSYQMICACSTEYSTGAVKNVSNTSRYQWCGTTTLTYPKARLPGKML